jgi:hypothetical protein
MHMSDILETAAAPGVCYGMHAAVGALNFLSSLLRYCRKDDQPLHTF